MSTRPQPQHADAVRLLWSVGLVPVPACAPAGEGRCSVPWHRHREKDVGKVPLLLAFNKLIDGRPSLEEVLAAFNQPFPVNIGIVVPNGLLIIEADSEAAAAELAQLVGDVSTPTRLPRPGRGPGLLLRAPHHLSLKSRKGMGAAAHIDLLGPGHFFIVAPSVSVSGHVYSWAAGKAPWEVAAADAPPALIDFLRRAGAVTTQDSAHQPMRPAVVFAGERDLAHGRRKVRATPRLRDLYAGIKRGGDESESGVDFSFAVAAMREGLSLGVVAGLLMERPRRVDVDERYVVRTVQNAALLLKGVLESRTKKSGVRR